MEWVFSKFDSSTTHQDLREILPNVRQAIIWYEFSSVERGESPHHTKHVEVVQDFAYILDANFTMDDKHENERMKATDNEMASLISSLNLGSAKFYWRIYAVGRRGNCWCRVQHGWVGGFGMGFRDPFEFIFEWRANSREWCKSEQIRPTNCNPDFKPHGLKSIPTTLLLPYHAFKFYVKHP